MELFAIAVGVVGRSGTGHISHNLEVVSEANTLLVPVHADILSLLIYPLSDCLTTYWYLQTQSIEGKGPVGSYSKAPNTVIGSLECRHKDSLSSTVAN